MYTFQYSSIGLSAFVLALIFTPVGNWLGRRFNIIAVPGGRRTHTRPISRLGGLGLAIGVFGALALSRIWPIPTADPNELRRFWGLMLGGALLFVVGLLDDRYDLPPAIQYSSYLAASGIAIAGLIILERFNNPFTDSLIILPALLYIPLTLFWMTGMIVTVNWLDGLDGLAAGVAAILAAVLSLHMLKVEQYSVAPQALALLGAALGFLVYNVSPARAFLGSNGALLLGYLIGGMGLIAGGRAPTVLLVMGIPIIDVAWTILDRIRHGVNPFKGDRRHLHFRLQDAGFSFIYWSFCALAGALALFVSSRLYKLSALGLLTALTLAVLFYLSQNDEKMK